MHYGEIKNCDIANGQGVRITIFVSGCTNRCENCFQPETWSFNYGEEFTDETIEHIINLMDKSYINGLTILGGEPLEPKNQSDVLNLIKAVRSRLPKKNIWVYTGFTYEQLQEEGAYCRTELTDSILSNIDVLVDGRFVEELKNLRLKFRGSSNQRLINMPRTLEDKEVVLLDI